MWECLMLPSIDIIATCRSGVLGIAPGMPMLRDSGSLTPAILVAGCDGAGGGFDVLIRPINDNAGLSELFQIL